MYRLDKARRVDSGKKREPTVYKRASENSVAFLLRKLYLGSTGALRAIKSLLRPGNIWINVLRVRLKMVDMIPTE